MSEFERLPVPAVAWTDEGLTVKLNPELVGRVNRKPYAIKVCELPVWGATPVSG